MMWANHFGCNIYVSEPLGSNIYENTVEIQFCEKQSMCYGILIGCFLVCKIFWLQYPQ